MLLWESTEKDVIMERERVLRRQQRAETLRQVLKDAGVGDRFVDRKLSDFEEERAYVDALGVVRSLWDDEGNRVSPSAGMALLGLPSSGKTSFAAALLRSAARRYKTVHFITGERLLRFHTGRLDLSTHSSEYGDYAERMDEWHEENWRLNLVYEFLVIDDVLRAKFPDFVWDELHSMLRERGDALLYTIITANATLKQIEALNPSLAAYLDREYTVVGFEEGTDVWSGKMIRELQQDAPPSTLSEDADKAMPKMRRKS